MEFIPGMQNWFDILISINVNYYIKTKKEKLHNHINRCRKAFDKIQNPFMKKTLSKLATEVNFLNLIKVTKNIQLTLYLMVRNSECSH